MRSEALSRVTHYLVTEPGLKSNGTDRHVKEYTKANGFSKIPKHAAYSVPEDSRTDMTEIYHFLAAIYRNQGALGDAKALYRKILIFKPGDRAAQKAMAEIDESLSLSHPPSSVPQSRG